MSHQLCAATLPLKQDKAKTVRNPKEIDAQTYQATPDAGSKGELSLASDYTDLEGTMFLEPYFHCCKFQSTAKMYTCMHALKTA